MIKKGGAMFVLLVLLLLASLTFLGYLVYLNAPGNPISLTSKRAYQEKTPDFVQTGGEGESLQFYPMMRFRDRVISFGIDPACSEEKKSQMLQAFQIIQDASSVRFVSTNDPELLVSCSEVAPPPDSAGHFVAGEGGPYEILNTSSYSIILSARISLYKDESCSTPHIAVHELLHALGFDHNANPKSILYPTLDCKQTLDSYFSTDLNELYKEDSLPDLVITNLNGTKSGRYLSFSVSVSNRGLQQSKDANLTLVDGNNEIVKEFELGKIDIGTTKILSVSNLAASRSDKEYRFIIDKDGILKELQKDNNEAILSLA